MTRSTKVSLKFSNRGRLEDLETFLKEYQRVLRLFIDMFWEEKNLSPFASKVFTDKIQSSLFAAAVQCAGKQAIGIVRGVRRKHEKRVYVMEALLKRGEDVSELRSILNKEKLSKPKVADLPIELDSRLVSFDFKNETIFDGWIILKWLPSPQSRRIILPFKKHRHFNSLLKKGKIKNGVRLSKNEATFIFELPLVSKTQGKTIGIDVGIANCIVTSAGSLTKPDVHGHTLISILKRISAKKRGSNGFRKSANHRKNYINWSINQLNFDGIKEIRCENIKDLRRGEKTSRFLSHWTYTDVFDKLERFCEEQGVLVTKVNPAYTSQICSRCGTLGKRRGREFVCSCGYKNNADLNAALNLAGEFTVPREKIFLKKFNCMLDFLNKV